MLIINSLTSVDLSYKMKAPQHYETYRKKLTPKRYFSLISIILIVIIGLILMLHKIIRTYSADSSLVTFTSADSTRIINIPDSSKILLYPGSEIIFDRTASLNHPKIILTGSALFFIHNKNPFLFTVFAGDNKIECNDAFYLLQQDSVHFSIIVWKGYVNFSRFENDTNHISIRENQQLTFNSAFAGLLKDIAVKRKSNSLLFSNTPLPEVLLSLAIFYNKTLQIRGESLPGCSVSGNFQYMTPEQSIRIINMICKKANINIRNNVLLAGMK